jgi:UDP-N-acetylmuramyl pentapeptide phosphotransferase/UDP-N-acetylglucosamine-1-phosphate transferase
VTLLAAIVAGFLAGRLVWYSLRHAFAADVFMRENYRGIWLPTAVGMVLPLTLLLVEGGRAFAAAAGVGERAGLDGPRALTLLTALGFGLLGAIDDLAGDASARGFRGHVRALTRGRLTTGGLKLIGGAAIAVIVCAPVAGEGLSRLLRDGALVALAANLGNLLDRAPGRAIKGALGAFVALVILASTRDALVATAVVAGAALALMRADLHERLMLGDAGANVLGAVLGLGVVLSCAPATRTAALVVVLALNLAAEVFSFSRVIDAVPPLRAIDRWGTRR